LKVAFALKTVGSDWSIDNVASLRASGARHDPDTLTNCEIAVFAFSEKRLFAEVIAGFITELGSASCTALRLCAISCAAR
jgi:hypothetical protein